MEIAVSFEMSTCIRIYTGLYGRFLGCHDECHIKHLVLSVVSSTRHLDGKLEIAQEGLSPTAFSVTQTCRSRRRQTARNCISLIFQGELRGLQQP
jgi:hypothetical protein